MSECGIRTHHHVLKMDLYVLFAFFIFKICILYFLLRSRRQESNLRPSDYHDICLYSQTLYQLSYGEFNNFFPPYSFTIYILGMSLSSLIACINNNRINNFGLMSSINEETISDLNQWCRRSFDVVFQMLLCGQSRIL